MGALAVALCSLGAEEAERQVLEAHLVRDGACRAGAPEILGDAAGALAEDAVEPLLRLAGAGRVCRALRTDSLLSEPFLSLVPGARGCVGCVHPVTPPA
jgi:hypothetical protein